MPSELVVCAVHEGGMRFSATAGAHEVTIDYPMRLGEEVAGPPPLQLLLASLAACSGRTLALLLGRAQQRSRLWRSMREGDVATSIPPFSPTSSWSSS